jgi:hypothetical protein
MIKLLLKNKRTLLVVLIALLLLTTIGNIFRQNIMSEPPILSKLKSSPLEIKVAATTPTTSPSSRLTTTKQRQSYNINGVYPDLIQCSASFTSASSLPNTHSPWTPNEKLSPIYNLQAYSLPASNLTHSMRITRAVLVYFPIQSVQHFEYEFKWMYRSWYEMQKYEPTKWRTDLVIFLERDRKLFAQENFFFNKLNCSFKNVRSSQSDEPMCTLIEFVPLQLRNLTVQKIDAV